MEALKSLLGSTIRIKIVDGRILEGEFQVHMIAILILFLYTQCIDKSVNIVIGRAKEFHGMKSIGMFYVYFNIEFILRAEDSDATAELTRNVGMAVILGKDIISVVRRKSVENHNIV